MSRPEFQNAFVLTGPTGSGKSLLALVLAERLGAEIVCMDSMTLYRGMDIGTAKPDVVDRARMPHHLLDVLDPWESASVAWWLDQAAACCRDIASRGKRALFVGGTPLYLKALLYGLFDGPPANSEIRQRLEYEATTEGQNALHARLATIDPATAARLHRNDVRRIVRALEVFELTGRPISEFQQQWLRAPGAGENANVPRCLWLDPPRSVLYDRINKRVEAMVAAGLIEEAKRLQQLDRPLSREASQAVGYAEMFDFLNGAISLPLAIDKIQMRTRNLAKRQLTWFRSLPECKPITEELTFREWGLTMDDANTSRDG